MKGTFGLKNNGLAMKLNCPFLKSIKSQNSVLLNSPKYLLWMVHILCHRFNDIYTVTSFKILNDVAVCTRLDL